MSSNNPLQRSGYDKVHAPDCSASIEVSVRAPHEWRPVDDARR
jgi:hypothetical protein